MIADTFSKKRHSSYVSISVRLVEGDDINEFFRNTIAVLYRFRL